MDVRLSIKQLDKLQKGISLISAPVKVFAGVACCFVLSLRAAANDLFMLSAVCGMEREGVRVQYTVTDEQKYLYEVA